MEGEFTQLFRTGVPQEQASGPPAAETSAVEDEFARLFGTAPQANAPAAAPPEPPAPSFATQAPALPPEPPSPAFSQVFDAAPFRPVDPEPGRRHADEATLIFEALPPQPPARSPQSLFVPAQAEPRPRPAAAAAAPAASEFTQIFSPIAPPTAPPPSASVGPAASAAPSSEFTQFFSAISARNNAGAALGSSPLARPVAPLMPAPAIPQRQSEEGFPQAFQPAAQPPAVQSVVAQPAAMPRAVEPVVNSPGAWPAFGPPAQAAGSFTDVFAAQRQPAPMPAPIAPGRPAPADDGGFTQLFQGGSPASAQGSQPFQASPFSAFHAPSSPAPAAPAWPSQPAAQPSATGGDFTRLMQSLGSAGSSSGAAFAPPANDGFFAPPGGSVGAPQESEFTRVQRASQRRDAGAAPSAPPSAMPSAAGSPGVAMGSPKQDKPAEEAPAKKSKGLIILLIAMNVLLLLVIVAIAVIVLRRK